MAETDHDVAAEAIDVATEEEIRICLFSIGEDYFALPIETLTEIIIPQKVFPVPTTPPHVLGVINLRGNIVPIVDIRSTLALPQKTPVGQVAIIKHGTIALGIAVDNVSEVISVPESSLLALPPDHPGFTAAPGRNRFFKAVVQREGAAAALLDLDKLIEAVKLV